MGCLEAPGGQWVSSAPHALLHGRPFNAEAWRSRSCSSCGKVTSTPDAKPIRGLPNPVCAAVAAR